MNVYDFDKTIYTDDSTVDFFIFCLKNRKKTLLSLPKTGLYGLAYILKVCNKTTFKQAFFGFLKRIDDIDVVLESFWAQHKHKIKKWYLDRQLPSDIIISASPEFLLSPVCKNVKLIGSRVDKRTGAFSGKNCYGQEKVHRLYEDLPGCTFSEFYSDSLSDTPLAILADKAYIVTKDRLIAWEDYKK